MSGNTTFSIKIIPLLTSIRTGFQKQKLKSGIKGDEENY